MSELVFITGATGFIGSQTAKSALDAGYSIRLSIRRKEQEQDLRSALGGPQHRVEFVHIPDLTREDAFEGALDGVDHIFHLASPLVGKGGEDVHKDYVDPAVKGTTAVLKEAKKHKQIKVVIVTSSVLALIPLGGLFQPRVHPKANTGERLEVDLSMEFPTGQAGHGLKYAASKILAHQATRDFIKEDSPHFKLITLHPVFVIGHSLVQKSFEQLDGVPAMFWNALAEEQPRVPPVFVDVKQCAEAHIKALQHIQQLETGREYLLSAPLEGWSDIASFVKEEYPQVRVKVQPGLPSSKDTWEIDTSLAEAEIGIKWHPVREAARDVIEQQLSLQKQAHL